MLFLVEASSTSRNLVSEFACSYFKSFADRSAIDLERSATISSVSVPKSSSDGRLGFSVHGD